MDATQTRQQYVGIDTGNALFTYKNNELTYRWPG